MHRVPLATAVGSSWPASYAVASTTQNSNAAICIHLECQAYRRAAILNRHPSMQQVYSASAQVAGGTRISLAPQSVQFTVGVWVQSLCSTSNDRQCHEITPRSHYSLHTVINYPLYILSSLSSSLLCNLSCLPRHPGTLEDTSELLNKGVNDIKFRHLLSKNCNWMCS